MDKVVIFGKCGTTDFEKIKKTGFETWALGTDLRIGADRYYEFHGINIYHKNILTQKDLNPEIYNYKKLLPLNNSISILLIQAYLEGYSEIVLMDAPMQNTTELLNQRCSVSMVIGYLLGLGISVYWTDSPENKFYLDVVKNDY